VSLLVSVYPGEWHSESLPRRPGVSRELINGLETIRIIVWRRLQHDEIPRRICIATETAFREQKCSNRSYRNRILRRDAFLLANFYASNVRTRSSSQKKVRAWRSLDWIILVSLGFLQSVFIAAEGYEYLSRANIFNADKWNVHPWSFNIWFGVIIMIKPFSTRCAAFSIIKC